VFVDPVLKAWIGFVLGLRLFHLCIHRYRLCYWVCITCHQFDRRLYFGCSECAYYYCRWTSNCISPQCINQRYFCMFTQFLLDIYISSLCSIISWILFIFGFRFIVLRTVYLGWNFHLLPIWCLVNSLRLDSRAFIPFIRSFVVTDFQIICIIRVWWDMHLNWIGWSEFVWNKSRHAIGESKIILCQICESINDSSLLALFRSCWIIVLISDSLFLNLIH